MLLLPPALAEAFVVNVSYTEEDSDFALLLRDDGTVLTPEKTYARIYELTPDGTDEAERLYTVEPADPVTYVGDINWKDLDWYVYHREALMDANGHLVTGFDYYSLTWLADGSIKCSVYDGSRLLSGAMDASGQVLIETKYTDLQPLGDGRWVALSGDEDNGLYALILLDRDGAETATGLHTEYAYLCENNSVPFLVEGVSEYDGKPVYLNGDGTVCVSGSFDDAGLFYGNCAVVNINGASGLIDRAGQLVVPLEYDSIYHADCGAQNIYIAKRGTELTIFDANAAEVLMRQDFPSTESLYADFQGPGLLWIYTDSAYFCYRTDGTLLGTFSLGEYRYCYLADSPVEAPRVIESSGQWPREVSRLLDLSDNPIGDDYASLSEGLCRDGKGRYVACSCPLAVNEYGEETRDWSKARYGVIDENGALIVPLIYTQYVQVLSADRFWVMTGDGSGMIDAAGKWYYYYSDYNALID